MNSVYTMELNYQADLEFININNVCFSPCTRVTCVDADVHPCSPTALGSSPYRPVVCRAFGSPPRISAAPPQRCEPRWRLANKSCRGCRCRAAAPRTQPAPGGLLSSLTADAPTQHPHLKGQNTGFWSDLFIYDKS